MVIEETTLPGVHLIELERREDERGFFARAWCEREFEAAGIGTRWVQANLSYNGKKGTLRGLHFQRAPHTEVKLVRCIRGAVYDVVVDMRPESPQYRKWAAFELTADNRRMLYVPEGFAHGYQTLTDDAELFYQVSAFYCPEASTGVRWDDPALAIDWPACERRILSKQDMSFPYLPPAAEAA